MSTNTVFVRIKPYNKRKGYLCRTYMTGGVRFTTRWQEVSAGKGRELAELMQPHDHEQEIPLFDIKTRDEAKAIEEREVDEGKRNVARVKDAPRVADRDFRNDRPVVDEYSGDTFRIVEPAEVITDRAAVDAVARAGRAAAEFSAGERADAAPAPSLRGAERASAAARTHKEATTDAAGRPRVVVKDAEPEAK